MIKKYFLEAVLFCC